MINCIIVDDEPLALDILENYISRLPLYRLVKKCRNALEAFDALHNLNVDLMFLDIKMPGVDGLNFVKSLKLPPAVIFTTAFSEYAVTGFDLDAVDYLVKPITFERFEKAVNKFLKTTAISDTVEKPYSYFKISGSLVKIKHIDILYARAVKDYVQICTINQKNYLTHMTMKYLNQLLPSSPFVRVHRSYIVNKNFLERINKNTVIVNTVEIPIGENYRDNLKGIC